MKDRLLAVLIWACFGWLVGLVLYAALAGAGESTMPGERAALKSTCANTPPFFCLAGRPGGQTLTCGTKASDGCMFNSTANATKGTFGFDGGLVLDGGNKCVGMGMTSCSGFNAAGYYSVGDGAVTIEQLDTYGVSNALTSAYFGRSAGGSKASPTATASGNELGGYGACGYDGTASCAAFGVPDVQIRMLADGAFTTSSHPTRMEGYTTASSTVGPTKRWTCDNAGNWQWTTPFTTYNNIALADTSSTQRIVVNGPAPITASSTAIANTVTETVFSNGTYNVAANTLTAGRTFRVQAWGQMGSTTTGPQINLRLRWGANGAPVNTDPLLIDLQGTEGISVTAKGWFATFVATCRTTGASGTVDGNGMGVIPNNVSLNDNQVGTTTVDTTAAKTLALFAKFGAAVAADTITLEGFTVEWLN